MDKGGALPSYASRVSCRKTERDAHPCPLGSTHCADIPDGHASNAAARSAHAIALWSFTGAYPEDFDRGTLRAQRRFSDAPFDDDPVPSLEAHQVPDQGVEHPLVGQ